MFQYYGVRLASSTIVCQMGCSKSEEGVIMKAVIYIINCYKT